MDWKLCVNLGTHKRDICHHYSFLASTLKLDSSEQGTRWEIIQQRQRNVPRSLNVLDGCRPELLKPWDVCASQRGRERERERDRERVVQTERTCNLCSVLAHIQYITILLTIYIYHVQTERVVIICASFQHAVSHHTAWVSINDAPHEV